MLIDEGVNGAEANCPIEDQLLVCFLIRQYIVVSNCYEDLGSLSPLNEKGVLMVMSDCFSEYNLLIYRENKRSSVIVSYYTFLT